MENLKNNPVAWFAPVADLGPKDITLSFALAEALADMGVKHAFGIVGGGNAPFAEALDLSPVDVWHPRHESGAAFAAAESSLATNSPTVVFVTTGPGLINALNGIYAARWDGAKVLLVSGSTNPEHKGRWAVQETSSYTMPTGELFAAGRLFDFAVQVSSVSELDQLIRRIRMGFSRPQGFVGHVSLPLAVQTALVSKRPSRQETAVHRNSHAPEGIEHAARVLDNARFALWVGFGARHAAAEVRTFAEHTGAPVMSTPRAKGIFPETHPQYIGVTGAGGHPWVEQQLKRISPDYILVLGTKMGEASSFWSKGLVPRVGFVQVDIDPEAIGVAYPDVLNIGIHADIKGFLTALIPRLVRRPPSTAPGICALPKPTVLSSRSSIDVRPQYLMQVLQTRVIDNTDAVLMSESGNAFSWANHYLRFNAPGRYRTSALYGSMGHVVTGVVGAALATNMTAVAIVGDGAMLMNNEVSTAVSYNAKAVWVVLNDSRYGITHQAMLAQGFNPVATEIPETNFVDFARSMGADGVRVPTESALSAAVDAAIKAQRPFVIDVKIDRSEVSPVLKSRIDSLKRQGAVAGK